MKPWDRSQENIYVQYSDTEHLSKVLSLLHNSYVENTTDDVIDDIVKNWNKI